MTLLLASWLATQIWSWSPAAEARSYRIYWSRLSTQWCETDYREYLATDICLNDLCEGDVPQPGWELTYFMVVARNQYGQGPTNHGEIVAVCP